MDEWVVKIVVVGFVAWVACIFLQPRYVFEVGVKDGRPSMRRGKVTHAFLHRAAEVCREYGVVRGWIGGVRRGHRVALLFSHHFPGGAKQRLRNEWVAAG